MDSSRFVRLFSHAASIPWLVFLWTVAEILERIEYIADKAKQIKERIVTPEGELVVVILCVAWLACVVMWPDIKRKFPNWHLPRSDHEIFSEINEHH